MGCACWPASQPDRQAAAGAVPAHRAIHKDCGLQQRCPQARGRPRPRLREVDAGGRGGDELAALEHHSCGSSNGREAGCARQSQEGGGGSGTAAPFLTGREVLQTE